MFENIKKGLWFLKKERTLLEETVEDMTQQMLEKNRQLILEWNELQKQNRG